MIIWSANFAYVIGLLTTDGNLSKDGRHIIFVSKDLEQINNFKEILKLSNKTMAKKSTYNPNGKYYQVQFGNVNLYRFLLSIGLFPNKSKTIKEVGVPDRYFADFLRGHLDGDGYTYSYVDRRWKIVFRFIQYFSQPAKST